MSFESYPLTRAQAKLQGIAFYYTGKPCPQGHFGLRYTTTGFCTQCLKEKYLERTASVAKRRRPLTIKRL